MRLPESVATIVRAVVFLAGAACLPAVAQYSVSSAVGPFDIPSGAPTASGGGTWPLVMPAGVNMTSVSLVTPVPSTAVNIKRVVLNSLVHSSSGELQIVLRAPSGHRYNVVHRPNFMNTATLTGQQCDFSGTYAFEDPNSTSALPWPPNSDACPATAVLAPGTYRQYFGSVSTGTWPTGAHDVLNVPLASIPVEPGLWRLEIFDWVAGSIGRVSSWRLEGDTGTGPTVYCTSGTSANGCVPAISATHQPSASLAHGCLITIVDADAQRSGLIFYGIDNTGFTPTTWGTGFLCSKVALQRTGLQSTGGNTYLCSGTLTLDWNAYQTSHPTALGNPFIAGRKAYVQGWNRDPASQKVSVMSNALEMTYQP